MSTISPGPATNVAAFESKTSDPEKTGKLKSAVDDSNASASMAANTFEKRCAEAGGVQH